MRQGARYLAMKAPEPRRLDTVPCGRDPRVRRLMMGARPYPCSSFNLVPVFDADDPPVFAVACDDCGEIEGDAPDLAQAVTNWNALQRAGGRRQ
jgi:hypothetical protein